MEQTIKPDNEKLKINRGKPDKVLVGACHPQDKQVNIVVEKEGDLVVAIRIACRCGEELAIKCVYPETN